MQTLVKQSGRELDDFVGSTPTSVTLHPIQLSILLNPVE